jgi:ribosome maturation factor RimP
MIDNIDLEKVSNIVRELLEDLGFRLYDINFNEVSRTLRAFIDKEGRSVTVNDCKRVSNLISGKLDELDYFDFRYTLEVSSPGIERQLKRPEHYKWAMGKVVEIDIGDKKIRGYLRKVQKNGIVIGTKSGEDTIPYASIHKAKVVEEILYGKRS